MSNPRQKKKLRRGHVPRQSKRQARARLSQRRYAKGAPANAIVAQAWDKTKSTKANFAALGLAQNPNSDMAKRKKNLNPKDKTLSTQVIQQLEELAEKSQQPYQAYCSRGEVIFIQECLRKHGTDFDAMAMDIELNDQQHTAAQLEKKVRKYVQTLEIIGNVQSIEEAAAQSPHQDETSK
eukprot:gene2000-5075_t